MQNLSFFSLTTTPIEVLAASGSVIMNATAFIYRENDENISLVTNWHVVTGRNPERQKESKTGAVPTHIRIRKHRDIGVENAIIPAAQAFLTISINSDSGEHPLWKEHPKFKSKVDVVVINLPKKLFEGKVSYHSWSDAENLESGFLPQPMDSVFVIGYPWGLSGGDGVLPIYKQGSVASDYEIDHKNLPRFLVDCRTAEGMSGSPVICACNGIRFNKIGQVINFAGVYSGRLRMSSAEEEAKFADKISEIGVVWRKTVLDEIIDTGVPGTKLSEIA